jgi:hypothetical protein
MAATRWLTTLAALVGIAIPVAWLLSVVTPGEEAVKIRNGLVATMGQPDDFTWEPSRTPASFRINQAAPAPEYVQAVTKIAAAGETGPLQGFELALAFARQLMGAPGKRVGGPIQGSLGKAYTGITQHGRGYCADFTQVFTGLAVAAGLPVRIWSISFQSFGAGHAFNEIYDQRRRKWLLVDPFHSLYFIDPNTQELLSVLEVHHRLLAIDGETRPVAIRRIVEGRLPFRSEETALEYYRRGMPQLALAWGNNVFDYDQSAAVRWGAPVSRHVERALGIVTGEYPGLRIYPRGVSHRDVDSLFRARNRFFAAVGACVVAGVVFGGLLIAAWRPRRVRA